MEPAKKPAAPVRIACIQMDPKTFDKEGNWSTVLRMMEEACADGATFLVLPELFNTGYPFETREEAFSMAEPVPEGETTGRLIRFAAEKRAYVVGSIVEQEGLKLYNTSVFAGPDGYIGKYRKTHLCESENFFFENGDLGFPVFHTRIGRVGMIICQDCFYPECFRILAMQQADLVAIPTNWATQWRMKPKMLTMGPALCQAAAISNYIFVAAANRIGKAGNYEYAGNSIISNPWGVPLGGPAGLSEEIVAADCNLSETREPYFNPYNARLDRRRIDLYDRMLGYKAPERKEEK